MMVDTVLLHDYIDLILLNKLHGQMQYQKRCYVCFITQDSNPPISQFRRPCYE